MTELRTDPIPTEPTEPTERPVDAMPDEGDVEGHNLATYELGRTVVGERQRQAELAARDARHLQSRPHRSLVDRLLGR